MNGFTYIREWNSLTTSLGSIIAPHCPLAAQACVQSYTRGIVHDIGRAPKVHCLLDLLLCQSTPCSCPSPLLGCGLCSTHVMQWHGWCRACLVSCCCLVLCIPDGISSHVSSCSQAFTLFNSVLHTPVCTVWADDNLWNVYSIILKAFCLWSSV